MKENGKRQYPELPGVKTLLEKVRDGDNYSFEPIYEFYRRRVIGYVRTKYYSDRASAEDIVQEVFLRAFLALKRGSLIPKDELGALLITIARNQMMDLQKVKKHLPNAKKGIEPSRDDVSQTAETNMELDKTLKAIARLSPVERTMIVEKAFKTQAEVAQSIGESGIFVHNRLHDVRIRLREEVGRPRRF